MKGCEIMKATSKEVDRKQGTSLLKAFRQLNNEEQRIACAVLDGMLFQKQLYAQRTDKEQKAFIEKRGN